MSRTILGKVETQFVTLQVIEGILNATYKPSVIDLEVAKEAVRVRKEYCQNKTFPHLIMDASVAKLTKDARDFLSSEEATEGIAAAAIITNSVFKQTMVNFWITVTRPKIPVRLFIKKTDAADWLKDWVSLD